MIWIDEMPMFICRPKIYRFRGWLFQTGYVTWPLNKDLEPKKRAGAKFYKMLEEFERLTDEQKEENRE